MIRALIYAHFDMDSIVDPHVLFQLRCVRPYFDLVYFVSACQLGWRDISSLSSLADRVICRENAGYDFLSWRTGYEALPISACSEITIMNDSCYGPICSLEPSFAKLAQLKSDLTALTINHQFCRHGQSNFIRFGSRLLRSGFASDFWRSVVIIPKKEELIQQYEVGLSIAVSEAGYTVGGLVEYKEVSDAMRRRVIAANEPIPLTDEGNSFRSLVKTCSDPNPNHAFWSETFAKGSPMLKVELIRDNPLHANISNVEGFVQQGNFYDLRLMRSHIRRVKRPS